MKIIVSAEADSDLLHILNYLAARDQAAAVALAGLFNTKFENLVFAFLSSGVSAPFLLRSVVAENYVIFYRAERERILIVRVVDGRRDIEAEFER